MTTKLSIVIIITLLTWLSTISLVNGGGEEDEMYTSWINRYSHITLYNNGKQKLTTYIGPQVFWNNRTNEWKRLLIEDHTNESSPYYLVRNSYVTAKIGISSLWDTEGVIYYDPDFTRKVAVEHWTVQGYYGGNWQTITKTYYNNTVTYNNTFINVTGLFSCWYNSIHVGWFRISYILRPGHFLKHEITYKNIIGQTIQFRVIMTLIGIAGKKVVHALGEDTITVTEKQIQSSWLRFVNNTGFQFLEERLDNLGHYVFNSTSGTDVWMNDYLKAIRLKLVDYEGRNLVQCDIVIGNYTLSQNENLVIDPATGTWSVDASSDDVYVNEGGDFVLDNVNVPAGDYSTTYYDYSGGMRFLNVTIPQGATIDSAYLNLTASGSGGSNWLTKIEGEDADDTSTFANKTEYDARPRTTANVDWDPSEWTTGTEYQSPDIKTVIQEIIDRAGWSSGNSIVIFWKDDQGSGYQAQNYLNGASYDHTSYDPPSLEITYSTGYTLTLQARDKDGTNLSRTVVYHLTFSNGTSTTSTSDGNGLVSLSNIPSGTTEITSIKWGTHTVLLSTDSFSLTEDTTRNVDTTIARLDTGSYYLLISIDQTSLQTPNLVGTTDWEMLGVEGSGSKELKVDTANWVDTNEPEILKIMGNPYETGWAWDDTNKIFTFTLDFDANPSMNIEMSWSQPTSSQTTGGGTQDSPSPTTSETTIPAIPESESSTISPYVIPEYKQPQTSGIQIPSELTLTIVVTLVFVAIAIYVYEWLKSQDTLDFLYKTRKRKKPKWR